MRLESHVLGRAEPEPATFKMKTAHAGVHLTAKQRHERLTDQTGKWVAQTFYGQMLKQMRNSPFKSKLFDGGRGGAAFQEMADQRTAESMSRGTGRRLVNSLVRHIEGKALYAANTKRAARHELGVA